MFRIARNLLCVALLAGLTACATAPAPQVSSGGSATYKVGKPYQIGDNWYYPHEQPDYDEVGIASWYGPTFYGKPTASGEIYDGDGLTAAHRTLPLPVNVRVTNLENGKSLVLRVNDRGPFAQGRIIDVSRHAAELLGFYGKGTAHVRVTYVGRGDMPSDNSDVVLAQAFHRAARKGRVETASLRTESSSPRPVRVVSLGTPPLSPQRMATPEEQTTPVALGAAADDPNGTPDHPDAPTVTRLYVQAGSFSSEENAERLRARLANAGAFISPGEHQGRELYRVRSGPYDDLESANAALAKLAELGNNGAQIVVDR